MTEYIRIKGAKEHNLKNIDIEIPRDKLVVITGISGSGKSTLAFDTIYAEGQRKYVESLSAYARQFLGQMKKPEVEHIDGLSPAISIDQKTTSKNPRSTVGTVTEIYDYLRLLFARVGAPHCPQCGKEIAQQTVQEIVDQVLNLHDGTRITILAPVVKDKKGEHRKILEFLIGDGFVRARIDGEVHELEEVIDLDKNRRHTIEVIVDRLTISPSEQQRLADSLETGLVLGNGVVIVSVVDGEERLFSEHFACPDCSINMGEIEPRMFSFNSPHGACPACHGLGFEKMIDEDLIVPDPSLSVRHAIAPWNKSTGDYYPQYLLTAAKHFDFRLDIPYKDLTDEQKHLLLYGSGTERMPFNYIGRHGRVRFLRPFEGVIPNLARRYRETDSEYIREEIEKYMRPRACDVCGGKRLQPKALSVTIDDRSIAAVAALSVDTALSFFRNLQLPNGKMMIAAEVIKELVTRLAFLQNVGLNYLTLDRASETLSGGEAQRIRLATQIGSGLVGVLYILDEPSIGLHQRDNLRLIGTLKNLRDLGNTLIVVEHDEEMIRTADYVIDMGPGAGEHGGTIVATGTPSDIISDPDSITGQYLNRIQRIEVPPTRRTPNGHTLRILGARHNNLKSIDVEIPLGVFTCVTGVSGSGKSTLINDILHRKLSQRLHRAYAKPGAHDDVVGIQHIDKVITIDQSPIGRTPRSNPATYTGVFDYIRALFAQLPDAKARGYRPGRFSFNVKGGRCEACRGDGIIKIEMHFLPDVYVPCEVCEGKRYNRETLEIRYKGKNIAQVLDMTVEEGVTFFENIPRIKNKLQTLYDVGLGYIKLGQPATTLSGGEAQRVKLATELSRRSTGKTFYILDEPTTGLHFDDIKKLLAVLGRLTDAGNSVLVIEHNLDVIKTADHIIDLGPEGGDEGGYVIAQGSPEAIARSGTYTGEFLNRVLNGS
ncbi:MAG: excinuclease ABC subunit UvrA [Halobacteriota archaeon]